jgi:hypothetical protein
LTIDPLEYEQSIAPEDNQANMSSTSSDNQQWSNVDSDLSEIPNNPPDPHPFSNSDYILTEYHPHSGRNSTTHTLSEYGRQRSSEIPPIKEPWKPFRTCLDFEICELALESYLNKTQLKKLITLVHRAVIAGPDNEQEGFTISSINEVEQIWELTAKQHVKGC